LRRRLGVLVATLVLAAGLGVSAAAAQRHMLVGIQDDSQTVYGNPTTAFALLQSLHAEIVRINLQWGGKFGVAARRRPAHPQDPADPAYNWSLYDRAVRYAAQNGIQVLFTILFTPRWANGGKRANVPPRNSNDLRNFAYAAAERYGGHYVPTNDTGAETALPAVKYWLAWNEPNNPIWLAQTSGGHFVSPRSYAKICSAIWTGVHYTNFGGEKVACGATAPHGNNAPRSTRPSVSPIGFLRALKKAGLRNFDAYAHHPYYGSPRESPTTKPPSASAITLANLSLLTAEVTRLYGPKRIWLTEYGYQTSPPDKQFGVSWATQARYLTQAYAIARRNPRIDLMLWFLLRDDSRVADGWQSGLFTASGVRKPAYDAFRKLPH
jgi:hypothetical protein